MFSYLIFLSYPYLIPMYICYSLTKLYQLTTLHLDKNDFSKGMPEVIGHMTSLKVLRMINCKLNDLPQRLVDLYRSDITSEC